MRIGILGYGSIGSRHGANLIAMGHKVIFHDPAMADGLPKDEVIKNSDAVLVCSPTSEHSRDITLCQATGKPCFAEKPIADARTKGVGYEAGSRHLEWPIMVGYNMRFHPCVIKAAEWLAEGRIGDPQWASFICAQYNDKPEYLRDGVTLNWSHEIDLALYLLGPAKMPSAAINKSDSIADIILRHLRASECQTHIHLDYITQPELRGFSIFGPNGVMSISLPQRYITLLGRDSIIKHQEQYPGDINDDYIKEMQAFIDRIEGKETLGCTAEEGIAVLEVCLKAKKLAGLK